MATMNTPDGPVTDTDPIKDFFKTLELMLGELAVAFPECKDTPGWISRLRFMVSNKNTEDMTALMRNWYDGMVGHIRACLARDPKPMLEAPVAVLQGIRFKTKWLDDDFSDESRAAIWEFMDTLNYLASLHFETPNEKLDELAKAAESLQTKFGVNFDQASGEVKFNLSALKTSLAGGDTELSTLMNSMQGLMPMMQSVMGGLFGGPPAGEATAAAPSGMHQFLASQMEGMGTVFPQPPKK